MPTGSASDDADDVPDVICCDRASGRDPCDLTLVGMAACACGKVYSRCRRHGGQAGAKRSLHAHRALYHPKEEPT